MTSYLTRRSVTLDPRGLQQFVNAEWSVLIEIFLGNNELICIHKISNMNKERFGRGPNSTFPKLKYQ